MIALALVGQATDFGDGFVAFGLVLLPVVYLLGVSTVARLGQVNYEDAVWSIATYIGQMETRFPTPAAGTDAAD